MTTAEQMKQFYASIESHPYPKEFTIMNAEFNTGGFAPLIIGNEWLPVLMTGLKPTGHSLFWHMAGIRDLDSNIAVIQPQTKTEANRLSRAYQDMNQKNLVKRIKPAHYLINPSAVIPVHTYPEVTEHWHSL